MINRNYPFYLTFAPSPNTGIQTFLNTNNTNFVTPKILTVFEIGIINLLYNHFLIRKDREAPSFSIQNIPGGTEYRVIFSWLLSGEIELRITELNKDKSPERELYKAAIPANMTQAWINDLEQDIRQYI